jgi:alpha-mannosidase
MQAGLTVSRPGVLVTAFGADPDGVHNGTLLRVWEQAGKSGELTVTLPGKYLSAAPVNLRGEPTGTPLAIRSGRLTLDLPAFAPASFILSPQ